MIHISTKYNSILNHYIAEIRDINIQNDPLRFRRNLERVGEIIGYEISKSFDYETTEITTPLGTATGQLMVGQPVIASILRAGLTMHNGLLNVFDRAENAFISAYRRPIGKDSFDVQVEYKACPDLKDKTLIIADPMLATGQSMLLVFEALLKHGTPKMIHIVSAIASQNALDMLEKNLPIPADIWVGAVDPIINDKSYIVPGLGDAGDLAYGEKETL
ncbi:uracil phosphoribosyltransferase [Crocinitomix algicola]|uniref:uracil phosphoribosyltransferase n=1 Tax=Crocinitomix algicola TaxID=1740263 RepID=UPI00082EE782|nr:uracil phosphoribosyltransferase [Crocinitomix algicola]